MSKSTRRPPAALALALGLLAASPAVLAMSGPLADKVAGFMAWVVMLVVPGALIYLFWMVHILPEKIAEKVHHPQKDAIHMICLLSLVFGGLLWPIAFILLGEVVRGAGEAGRCDAAVTAGGPGADAVGLEQQGPVAAFGQRNGGSKSGKAAADDAGRCTDSAGD